jgi:hypothetical protein
MISATSLRSQIQGDVTVETEIYLINMAILAGVASGLTSVVLNMDTETSINGSTVTGSPMTTNGTYLSTWYGTIDSNWQVIEMNKVVDYFTKLGYTISRKSDDMEHLYWQITW